MAGFLSNVVVRVDLRPTASASSSLPLLTPVRITDVDNGRVDTMREDEGGGELRDWDRHIYHYV